MGTFLTFHLAGGKLGMKHMLEQFGPALKLPWTKLKAPKLSKKLSIRVISGTKSQAKGKSVAMISSIRDEYLVNLQKLRKKYEDKLRKRLYLNIMTVLVKNLGNGIKNVKINDPKSYNSCLLYTSPSPRDS